MEVFTKLLTPSHGVVICYRPYKIIIRMSALAVCCEAAKRLQNESVNPLRAILYRTADKFTSYYDRNIFILVVRTEPHDEDLVILWFGQASSF